MNSNKEEIYLDHAASSPVHPTVASYFFDLLQKKLGNSSSIHHSGVRANTELEKARMLIAKKLNCESDEVVFTSGATEANNMALLGVARALSTKEKKQILISSIEHSSVKETAKLLASQGFDVRVLDVDEEGFLSLSQLEKMIGPQTLLVSVVHGNNEIGTIQKLKEIGTICKKHNALFHSDGAQSFCKTPVDVQDMQLDLYTMSSHKIHGPRGVGAIYIKEGIELAPLIIGGGQEHKKRAGTVPVELIASMAFATKLFTEENLKHLISLKNYMHNSLQKEFPVIRFHGSMSNRLPNQLNFAIPGFKGKDLLHSLDKNAIRVSVGSACYSGKTTPSHVLKAINLSDEMALEAIRISWGIDTREEEIDTFVAVLKELTAPSI